MKKVLAIILAAVMVIGLAACGASGGASGGKLDAVKKAGKLTIATSPDFPPFENLEGTEIVGIEVEIMNAVCEKLGVSAEYVQMDFDSVVPGVQTGKYDIGMSGISVTDERKKSVLFTDPYCLAAQAIVVLEGSEIKSKADLDGKKVSVQSGTTAEDYVNSQGYSFSAFAANADAEQALVSEKVDAWVIDDLTAAEMVAEYNSRGGQQLVILGDAMTTEPYAFCTALGNDDLIAAINDVIKTMLSDGTIAKLFEKYEAPYTKP